MKYKHLVYAVMFGCWAASAAAQELTPPAVLESAAVAAPSGSLTTTNILITVLATLLVGAAWAQNDRAKSD